MTKQRLKWVRIFTLKETIDRGMKMSDGKVENKSLTALAGRLEISEDEVKQIVINTIMPDKAQTKKEDFVAFLAVANEYGLNPLTKEIYAFKANGGITPIVSIDGWLKIINTHHQFNGMTFRDNREEGKLISITCFIHKKGIDHPVEVTEYMDECAKATGPWKQWPARMLRHKATIQCGRYAFGLSGIVDPDEADRIKDATTEKDMGTVEVIHPDYDDEEFDENFKTWSNMIHSGKRTPDEIITIMENSQATPTQKQIDLLNSVEVNDEDS